MASTGNTLRAVLDTNVLYSGVLFEGLESDLLDLGFLGYVRLCASEYILDELFGVFERKALPIRLARQFLEYSKLEVVSEERISKHPRFGEYLSESKKLVHDPKDRPIFVFAKTIIDDDPSAYLVSGDKGLLKRIVVDSLGGRVLRTQDMVNRIGLSNKLL